MGIEIERRFLVKSNNWRPPMKTEYCIQGYLQINSKGVVRVRIMGDRAFITIKKCTVGISRVEYEYEIPLSDARDMIDSLCIGDPVEKYRHTILTNGIKWEIDEFVGANIGLTIAEVELETDDQVIALPDWIGMEVSKDYRYMNSNLATHPFPLWEGKCSQE